MSIIYDRKEIRSRMRDEMVSKPEPVNAPPQDSTCLSCGFWWSSPNAQACPFCGGTTPQG